MADHIMDRLHNEARSVESVFPSIADALRVAADEITRLRAVLERKADYAERMDALAEERLIALNKERYLSDKLAKVLETVWQACWCSDEVHESTVTSIFYDYNILRKEEK